MLLTLYRLAFPTGNITNNSNYIGSTDYQDVLLIIFRQRTYQCFNVMKNIKIIMSLALTGIYFISVFRQLKNTLSLTIFISLQTKILVSQDSENFYLQLIDLQEMFSGFKFLIYLLALSSMGIFRMSLSGNIRHCQDIFAVQ